MPNYNSNKKHQIYSISSKQTNSQLISNLSSLELSYRRNSRLYALPSSLVNLHIAFLHRITLREITCCAMMISLRIENMHFRTILKILRMEENWFCSMIRLMELKRRFRLRKILLRFFRCVMNPIMRLLTVLELEGKQSLGGSIYRVKEHRELQKLSHHSIPIKSNSHYFILSMRLTSRKNIFKWWIFRINSISRKRKLRAHFIQEEYIDSKSILLLCFSYLGISYSV